MSDLPEVRDQSGRFLPGKSGNPNGRPREEFSLTTLLRASLTKIHPLEQQLAEKRKTPPRTNGELLVEKLYAKVLAGDLKAIQIVMDRLEGKARSTVDVSGTVEHDHQHRASGEVVEALISRLSALRKQQALPERIDVVDAEIVS